MLYLSKKAKRVAKFILIAILALFVYGIFRLFFPVNSVNFFEKSADGGKHFFSEETGSNSSMLYAKKTPISPKIKNHDFLSSDGIVKNKSEKGSEENGSGIKAEHDRKIIKTGNLNLKVKKTEKAAKEIYAIANEQGGEVFSTDFQEKIRGQKIGNITVKVPVVKFEETLVAIKSVAVQVVSESTTGQDITDQYVDLRAQLKNKQAEEESFIKILNNAEKIDDVLAVTKEVSRVRGEIERLEGRIKYLKSQTNMSIIFIALSEDAELTSISGDWRPGQVVKKSFIELIGNIQNFINKIIRFVIVGIPSLISLLLLLATIYWIVKKAYQRMKK